MGSWAPWRKGGPYGGRRLGAAGTRGALWGEACGRLGESEGPCCEAARRFGEKGVPFSRGHLGAMEKGGSLLGRRLGASGTRGAFWEGAWRLGKRGSFGWRRLGAYERGGPSTPAPTATLAAPSSSPATSDLATWPAL
jgi:hypothetical protein